MRALHRTAPIAGLVTITALIALSTLLLTTHERPTTLAQSPPPAPTDTPTATPTNTPAPTPAAPTGLSATPGNKQISISWNNPNDPSITQYQYQISPNDFFLVGWDFPWGSMTGSNASTTTFTISSGFISNDIEYRVRIRAVNANGNGQPSSVVYATPKAPPTNTPTPTNTPAPTPAAPTGLSAKPGNKQISISWNNPNDPSITQYQYQRTPVDPFIVGWDFPWERMPGSNARTTTFTILSGFIHNGIEYRVRIRAVNANGNGQPSGVVYATPKAPPTNTPTPTNTPAPTPAAPTGLSAKPGNKQISISWNNPNDPSITQYQYQRTPVDPFIVGWDFPWERMPGSNASTTTFTILSGFIHNGIEYRVRIRAVNANGNGQPSGVVYATPKAPPTNTPTPTNTPAPTNTPTPTNTPAPTPAAPSGLSATPGNKQISISWNNPNDPSITQYQYQRTPNDPFLGGWDFPWEIMLGSNASTTTFTISSGFISNDIEYRVRIRAVNANGNSQPSSVVYVTPKAPPTNTPTPTNTPAPTDTPTATPTNTPVPPPAAPTGLNATPGNKLIFLSWNNPNDPSITKYQYQFQASLFGDAWGTIWLDMPSSNASTTSYTIPSNIVFNGIDYRVRIRAVNNNGSSQPSNVIGVMPKAPPTNTPTPTNTPVPSNTPTNTPVPTNTPTATATNTPAPTPESIQQAATATNTPVPTPAAPSGLSATPGNKQIFLSWNNPNDPSITKYQFQKTPNDFFLPGWDFPWESMLGSNASTTTFTISTGFISNDIEYRVRIRAVNANGNSQPSGVVYTTPKAPPTNTPTPTPTNTPAPPPAAPTELTATSGERRISLSWNNPNDPSITKYQYQHIPNIFGDAWDTLPWVDIPSSNANTNTFVIGASLITIGLDYRVRIRAVNDNGNSQPSNVVFAFPWAPPTATPTNTPAPPPAAPTGLSATPGNKQISISWNNPNDASITQYQYQRTPNDPFLVGWDFPWESMLGSNASTTTFTISSGFISNGIEYRVRIRAVNNNGNSQPSSVVYATPKAPPTATPTDTPTATPTNTPAPTPAAPTGLTATPGNQQISLSWNNPNDPSITKYQFQYVPDYDFEIFGWGPFFPWTDIPSSNASTTTFIIRLNLVRNNIEYIVRIRAVNDNGNSQPSNVVFATPKAPPPTPKPTVAPTPRRSVDSQTQQVATSTSTPRPTQTPRPTATTKPNPTRTPQPTAVIPTRIPTPPPTATLTPTAIPSDTPTPTLTPTATWTPTPSPTSTSTSTITPTPTEEQLLRPNTPDDVAVTPSGAGAFITWTPGNGGNCHNDAYFVRVLNTDGNPIDESYLIHQSSDGPINWSASGLAPNSQYSARIYGYSYKCQKYAPYQGEMTFTTTDESDDPEPGTPTPMDDMPEKRPAKPTDVKVTTPSDDTATITWTPDSDTDDDECPSTLYFVRLYEVGGQRIAQSDYISSTQDGNPTWSVSDLKPGTQYRIAVYSYGQSCGSFAVHPSRTTFTTTQ